MRKLKLFIRSLHGLFIIRNLIRKNKKYCLIINVFSTIGDLCICLSYYNEFLKLNSKNSKVIVLDKKVEIAQSFNICNNNIIKLNLKELTSVQYAIRNYIFRYIINKWINNGFIKIANPTFYFNIAIANRLNLSAIEIIKYVVLELDENAKIQYPIVPCTNSKFVTNKPYIIINPYSTSMKIPNKIFNNLVLLLNKIGYVIYCNISPSQKPIDNTIPLNISIDELFNIARNATCIISIRSGILDYIISNSKKMYVLYENNAMFPSYSLKSWQTNCKLYEHIYQDSITPEDIIKEIFDNDN